MEHFSSIEEVISNEFFLAWYYRLDEDRAKEWELWLLQHPQYVALTQESIAWLKSSGLKEKEVPVEKIDGAYRQMLDELDKAPVVRMEQKKPRWIIPAVAAAMVLLIAGYVLWNRPSGDQVLESAYGKISEFQLPDGSEVILNANSALKLDKDWKEGKDREVWLTGEAFFKVQKTSAGNRFIVHTNSMDIIVTGTQFNAISSDEEASVLLTEGKVTVQTCSGNKMELTPGEFVRIENCIPARLEADKEKVLAWKQARLDFENTPMNEVARIITRHYGVKVTLSGENTADRKISGVMPNDSLDVLIKALEATGDFRITRSDNELIISAL